MIRDALLATGLLLSTATQLRISGVPLGLGPGELLLAVWILVGLADTAVRRNLTMSPAVSRLLTFWMVFAIAQSIGQFVGLAIEQVRDTAGAMRTAKAYLLVAVLSYLVVALPDAGWRLRRIAWIVAGAGGASLAVLVAGGYGLLPVPGIDFWVFRRFIGWSTNPNQFALLCTVLVLVSLHLAETATRPNGQALALLCGVPAFFGGVLTKSDSFILAMVIAAPMFLGIKILHWAFLERRGASLRSTLALLTLLGGLAGVVAAVPFVPRIVEKAHESAVATMEQNDQAEGRFRLWRDAMEVGLDAGMLGLGPGPHLLSKQWKMPPPQKNEAHNTLLDLFTQGGLLAVASAIWITAASLLAAYRARLIGLTALILSLFIFSNFHLIVRHPIFWFSIAFCLTAADAARQANAASLEARRARPFSVSAPGSA